MSPVTFPGSTGLEMHLGDERGLEFQHPLLAKRDQPLARRLRFEHQASDIHPHATGLEVFQHRGSRPELRDRPVEVAVLQVIEPDPDVKYSLVQEPNLVSLRPPHQLKRLVLVEKLARVELVNRLE